MPYYKFSDYYQLVALLFLSCEGNFAMSRISCVFPSVLLAMAYLLQTNKARNRSMDLNL